MWPREDIRPLYFFLRFVSPYAGQSQVEIRWRAHDAALAAQLEIYINAQRKAEATTFSKQLAIALEQILAEQLGADSLDTIQIIMELEDRYAPLRISDESNRKRFSRC